MGVCRWLGALVLAALGAAACAEEGNGDEEARQRLVTDAELACLAAYGRDRDCRGLAAAGTPEAACPPGEPGELHDAYGPDCLRAHIALWRCEAALECSEAGCETEAETAASACSAVADGG